VAYQEKNNKLKDILMNLLSSIFSCKVLGFIFLVFSMSFPRAYGEIKLIFLVLIVIGIIIETTHKKIEHFDIFKFFACFSLINLLWLIVGGIYGNPEDALISSFRVFVIYPLIISLLWMKAHQFKYKEFIHSAVILSSWIISTIIIITTISAYSGASFFPESFIKENLLIVGIHEGYSQILSHNIGSLFFIVGYLSFYVLISKKSWTSTEMMTLLYCIAAAILSSRRALYLVIILSPILIILVNKFIFLSKENVLYKTVKYIFFIVTLIVIYTGYLVSINTYEFNGFTERFFSLYVDETGGGARYDQASLLISGFMEYPLFGSGIGGLIGMVRSEESPWLFELTYLQLLFNFGLIGCLLFILLFSVAINKIRNNSSHYLYSIEDKSMLTGIFSLMLGSISNPYLGSFDFLLFIGIIPFLMSKCQLR